MLNHEIILFFLSDLFFYNFYFFWSSYWTEMVLCQTFILYFMLLLYFSTNLLKSFFYTSAILFYSGIYLAIIQFDMFMCFLWLFEFTLFFLIFILLSIYQYNQNYPNIYYSNKKFLYYVLIFSFIYVYYLNSHLNLSISQLYLSYLYYYDVYNFFNDLENDLFMIFLIYYYYYLLVVFIILLIILMLTYIVIAFFKLLKFNKMAHYMYFWDFSNKFFKKQSYEYQLSKKSSINMFM